MGKGVVILLQLSRVLRAVLLVLVTLPLLSQAGWAVRSTEKYCDYVMQEAAAQRDQLRTPSLVTGMVQPTTGEAAQVYWGLSNSLSDDRKAALLMKAARADCQLYRVSESAQLLLQFSVPQLERDAVRHRLDLIHEASVKLDALIAAGESRLAAQNATRPSQYPLLAARVRLASYKANAALAMSAYVPELSETLLKQLVSQKNGRELEHQRALNAVMAQNNWNVSWSIGMRHQLSEFFSTSAVPYGEVTVSYNLASRRVDADLARAADSFVAWQGGREGEVARRSAALEEEIKESIRLHQSQLEALLEEAQEIEKNLRLLDGVDTSAADGFRNQLLADRTMLDVDIGDITYRLGRLRAFLERNF
jgi:hypothetical protein